MNTTRGILNARTLDPAGLALTRTHRAHTRTSRAADGIKDEPSPFDRAMQAAERRATKDDASAPPGASESASSAPRDADASRDERGCESVVTAAHVNSQPAEVGQPAADAQVGRAGQLHSGAVSVPDADAPPHAMPDQHETNPDAALTGDEVVGASRTLGALLSAPLTVHNLNELLATIDPRLAQHAPVRVASSTARPDAETPAVAATQGEAGEPGEAGAEAHGSTLDQRSGDAARPLQASPTEAEGPSPGMNNHQADSRTFDPGASTALKTAAQPADGSTRLTDSTGSGRAAVTPASHTPSPSAIETLGRAPGSVDAAKAQPSSVAPAGAASTAHALHALTGSRADNNDHALHGRPAAVISQAGADAADQTFTGQVSRGLAAALRQGADGTVTIRLHPASLGAVRVRVAVDAGKVNVRFAASTPQARALLVSSLGVLRESVERRGLGVESLAVDEDDSADAHRTEAVRSMGMPAPSATADEARPQSLDHGGSAATRLDDGRQGPGEHAGSGHGAERRDESGGGAAGDAVQPADQDARGVVRVREDGVHEHNGRVMLRLDALA